MLGEIRVYLTMDNSQKKPTFSVTASPLDYRIIIDLKDRDLMDEKTAKNLKFFLLAEIRKDQRKNPKGAIKIEEEENSWEIIITVKGSDISEKEKLQIMENLTFSLFLSNQIFSPTVLQLMPRKKHKNSSSK